MLTGQKELADYFEKALAVGKNAKGVGNWIQTETLRWLGADPDRELGDYPVAAEHLGGLVRLIDQGTISGAIDRAVILQRHINVVDADDHVKNRNCNRNTQTSSTPLTVSLLYQGLRLLRGV